MNLAIEISKVRRVDKSSVSIILNNTKGGFMNKKETKRSLKTLFKLFNEKVEKATEAARRRYKKYKKLTKEEPEKTAEKTPLAKDIPPPHKGGIRDKGDRDFL